MAVVATRLYGSTAEADGTVRVAVAKLP